MLMLHIKLKKYAEPTAHMYLKWKNFVRETHNFLLISNVSPVHLHQGSKEIPDN